jgi:chromosome segregation ATPase
MSIHSGCGVVEEPLGTPYVPAVSYAPPPTHSSVRNKFSEPDLTGTSAVETALAWSEKYQKLATESAAIQETKGELSSENRRLKEKVAQLDSQLAQAKKELSHANEFLVDMRLELQNWKNNVLGFREEIRKADTAQLNALIRILQILGSEIIVENTVSAQQSLTLAGPKE